MANRNLVRSDFARAVAAHRSGLTAVEKASFSTILAAASKGRHTAAEIADRYGEQIVQITKAASSPATTGASAWAGELGANLVGDYLSLLPSASGSLIAAGRRVSLTGINTIKFPARAASIASTAATWIGENTPIPVVQINLKTGATVGPAKKLAIELVATNEMLNAADGEQVFSTLLGESCAYALDAKLFSADAATSAAPAGLLDGVEPLTASGESVDLVTACRADLEMLLASIAAVSANAAFITNPSQAFAIAIRLGNTLPERLPVWSSAAIAPGVVIALDPGCFVSGVGPDLELRASGEGVVHMDTDPDEIATVGTPNEVAAVVQSLFQIDAVALRMVVRAGWAMRAPAIAWVEDVTWGVLPS